MQVHLPACASDRPTSSTSKTANSRRIVRASSRPVASALGAQWFPAGRTRNDNSLRFPNLPPRYKSQPSGHVVWKCQFRSLIGFRPAPGPSLSLCISGRLSNAGVQPARSTRLIRNPPIVSPISANVNAINIRRQLDKQSYATSSSLFWFCTLCCLECD